MQQPATTANQITRAYYLTLLELGLRHKVTKLMRRNGSHVYYTYHYTGYDNE